ncbi:MAG: EAL domain-containing protein [Bacillus sp. (in: Bacteria)]|nr:EAL domain-containing protein [Bacillus sp. (in: firmicutes)]
MDALEVMANLERVLPHFQPIFSADEHTVIGYEVLGRYQSDTSCESLGHFFHNDDIPDDFKREVDQVIITKALEKAIDEQFEGLLFFNQSARLLMSDQGEQLLTTLQQYEQKGFPLSNIVLELTQENNLGEEGQLEHFIRYFRTYGVKFAISKHGQERIDLKSIANLSPDIIKIDLQSLRYELGNPTFKEIVYSLSMLARKIGASLLFEKIEMEFQFQFAWKNGGRFYQGYYLQKPQEVFVEKVLLKDKLKQLCQKFITHEKAKIEKVQELASTLNDKMSELIPKFKKQEKDYEGLLKQLAKEFSTMSFRFYVTDENGFQLSPNLFKSGNKWVVYPQYVGKNWSWRPYFLENIMKMRTDQRGILSDVYGDIETSELIRTFAYPIHQHHFLFMDLSFDYLYERAELL